MSNPSVLSDRSRITSLVVGLLLGVLLAFGTSLVFLLIIFGPLLGLGVGIAGLMSGGLDGRSLASAGSGLLIGMGGVYLLEALNVLNACSGSQDVCGGASALPFLGFAIVVVALGLLVEGIAIARAH